MDELSRSGMILCGLLLWVQLSYLLLLLGDVVSTYVVVKGRGGKDLVVGKGVVCADCGLVAVTGFCWSLLHVLLRFVLVLVDSSCLLVFGGIELLKDIAGVG